MQRSWAEAISFSSPQQAPHGGKRRGGGAAARLRPPRKARTSSPADSPGIPNARQAGRVAIIVSVPKQRVYVYRNGILIGVSTCSTGKKGFETPTGVFTVLEKAEEHYSKEFDDAPMPFM